MTEETTLLYLEADDEVTSVARRIRQTEAAVVVLVVPGRSRATSSVVALRLLAREAEEAGRRVAVVGDALTRSLAAEAGIDAYRSVEDARNAVPAPAEPDAPRASINVIRGRASDGTQPVALAAAAPPVQADAENETRAVPVVRPPAPARELRGSRRSPRRAIAPAMLLGGLAVLLIAAGVLGATVLPAATVTIVPATERLGPVSDEIPIGDPVRLRGSVDATATVTATGTYSIQVAATGAVVFFNFNSFNVAVDAGTLVAAGDQAFGTTEEIVVPAGELTADGRIRAGEGAAGVAASAFGPNGNVAAEAIDTILSQSVAARLRGFPNNPERLVINPEPTAGGIDDTGPEIVQADVDAAFATLLESLDVAVADAVAITGNAIFADPAEMPAPVIEGLDGLVGTRDLESAEISGTLAYDRLSVDGDEVIALATERLLASGEVVSPGHELLPSATEVSVGGARREGDALLVAVSMTGASTPALDREEVIARVRGRPADEARAALSDFGEATVDLWPGWVGSVPGLDWRIEVVIGGDRDITPPPSSSAPPAT